MHLLITGATGFLGTYVVRDAIARGHRVTALRRSIHSSFRCECPTPQHWLTKPMSEALVDDVKHVDAVIHLAAAGVSPQQATVKQLFDVNVVQSLQLWKTCIEAGIRKLVVCGSCLEYGDSGDRYEFIPPDAPLEPTSMYGVSKAAASMAFHALVREHPNIDATILRPFNCYGDGQHESNLWPSVRRAAMTGEDFCVRNADAIRDFTHVSEIASAFVDAATREVTPQLRTCNVGTGIPTQVLHFVEHWWEFWKAKGRIRTETDLHSRAVRRLVPLVDPT